MVHDLFELLDSPYLHDELLLVQGTLILTAALGILAVGLLLLPGKRKQTPAREVRPVLRRPADRYLDELSA